MRYLSHVEYREPEYSKRDYASFLASRFHSNSIADIDDRSLPDFLFPFQKFLTAWALEKNRAAIFADCGMGKTPMQLVWAQAIVEKTNQPVLILTPLAVSHQTVKEAEKFGIDCSRKIGGECNKAEIVITNYEKIHHFNRQDFAGVVCDESSAIKSFNGKRRALVTEFLRPIQYRLLCTATAAPNDYIELGTSSEALGEMGHMDMLTRFFKHDQNSNHPNRRWASGNGWRFRGHSAVAFWRWVCTWARALRKPSDYGFNDNGFVLPGLIEREHMVEARTAPDGMLFTMPATNMLEERGERRRTIRERCEMAASLVSGTKKPAVIWCHLNNEGELLEKMIPDGKQISGAQSDDTREEIYKAFTDGQLRVVITKPKIGAWGLNWQHCNHVVTFASHSYEQYYQSIRRCWRFGQKRPVTVDMICTEGERRIKENLQRKARAADQMFTALASHMNSAAKIERTKYGNKLEVPSWLS